MQRRRWRYRQKHVLAVGLLLVLCMTVPFSANAAVSRVSLTNAGTQFTGTSTQSATSQDGRYVAFSVYTSPINQTNVYLRDRQSGTTTTVGVAPSTNPAISGDGRYTAYVKSGGVYVFDKTLGTRTLVSVSSASVALSEAGSPSISDDGRYVAFTSSSATAAPPDTCFCMRVFRRDRQSGTTDQVTVGMASADVDGGSADPSISADGRYVVFGSDASNLVSGDTDSNTDVFRWDANTGATSMISVASSGQGAGQDFSPAMSADGNYVAWNSGGSFAGDGVYLRNISAGSTARVSVSSAGGPIPSTLLNKGAVSDDGRYVTFAADGGSSRYYALVRDRQTATTRALSIPSGGGTPDSDTTWAAISGDGSLVSFDSDASNLVASDTNSRRDVFVETSTPSSLSLASLLAQYAPQLEYDSAEAFRADSAATITDNYVAATYSNLLKFRTTGAVLASSDPAGTGPTLALSYLGRAAYSDANPTDPEDYIDIVDDGDPGASPGQKMYDAQRLHLIGSYANKTYGRALYAPDGSVVLQYWLFYYDNPKTYFFGGSHEGDWEMVQVELDGTGSPQSATYAQHTKGEHCPWSSVLTSSGAPVVYVAEGSHASYFTAGEHNAQSDYGEFDFVNDYADGAVSGDPLGVIDVTSPPGWIGWPGQWGGASDSPESPENQIPKWEEPLAWAADAASCTVGARRAAPAVLAAPVSVTAVREGTQVEIRYGVGRRIAGTPEPLTVLTSLDRPGDRFAPSTARTALSAARGRVVQDTRGPVPTTARVALLSKNGSRSSYVVVPVR